jgi:hypothetical protein
MVRKVRSEKQERARPSGRTLIPRLPRSDA